MSQSNHAGTAILDEWVTCTPPEGGRRTTEPAYHYHPGILVCVAKPSAYPPP
jgi:hypothetical protein